MRHTQEFIVDGVTYKTTHYPATESNKLLAKIGKLVGPAFAALGVAGLDADVTPDLISSVVGELFKAVDEHEIDNIVKRIMAGTQIVDANGIRSIQFDTDFAGKIGHLYKVVKEVLSFQYTDFFAALVELMGQGLAMAQPAAQAAAVSRIKAKKTA